MMTKLKQFNRNNKVKVFVSKSKFHRSKLSNDKLSKEIIKAS